MQAGGLLLVGCGKMGSAMLAGWMAAGSAPAPVFVVEPTDLPVQVEYSPTPTGPWSPDRPPGANEAFARIRLL